MNGIVKVISSAFDSLGRLNVKSLFMGGLKNGKGDLRDAIDAPPFGIDSNPTNDKRALYVTTSKIGKYYIVGYVLAGRLAQPGETRIFSTDADGVLQAYTWHKADGSIEQNGNDNFAVMYNETKQQLDALKQSHNDLVAAFNAHMHATAGTGPPVPPTPVPNSIPAIPNTSDFSTIKNERIKTNS